MQLTETDQLRQDWLRWGLEEIVRCTDMRAGNGDALAFGVAMEALRSAGIGEQAIAKPERSLKSE